MGRKFLVRIDQKSLKFLLEQRETNLEYQKWLTKILGFDFDIHYKSGLENKAADALSRIEATPHMFVLSMHVVIQLEEIGTKVEKDLELKHIKEDLLKDPTAYAEFTVVQGRLMRQEKLVIPQSSHVVALIINKFHDGKTRGHKGTLKT